MQRVGLMLVTGLGSGLSPIAPGTAGSVVAVGLWMLAVAGCGGNLACLNLTAAAGVAVASLGCVALSPGAILHFGRSDPKPVVLDEWAGQWIALMVYPFGGYFVPGHWPHLMIIAASQFMLFRLFDVMKFPPCRRLERLPLGWGILCDDLFAGLYANICGQALLWLAYART
ncbi:MAG: Phosphatidylglycerophosphatase A [Phycisphaerae bacterium]|nr:Phosphatidylglycerophosphatase A [Phycisphaerae bacterium]